MLVGGDADAVCRATLTTARVVVDARVDHDAAAVGRELARVADQVAEHLRQPRAVGLRADRRAPAGAPRGAWPARSAAGRHALDRVLEHRRRGRRRSTRSVSLSRLIRLTSSRSSIRRTRWLELALHHAARLRRTARRRRRCAAGSRASCAAARAGCAARARASRGTRPSGGRRPSSA